MFDITTLLSRVNAGIDSYNSIATLQADSDLNHRKFLYICGGGGGFGSEINQLLLGFAYSVVSGRQFLIDTEQWNYGQFRDFFTFPEGFNRSLPYQTMVLNDSVNQPIQYLKSNHVGRQLVVFQEATRHVHAIKAKRPVAHYFWRLLTNETAAFMERCRVKNLSDYIGVHVRRGDKSISEAKNVPVMNYIQKIEETFPAKKGHTVFVTSDDSSVLDEFPRLRPTWMFASIIKNNSYTLNYTGHVQFRFNNLPAKEKLHQTRALLCEIQMLINAEYVFCTMSSNICRLVQILRHQDPSTVFSLDREWFAMWHRCIDARFEGKDGSPLPSQGVSFSEKELFVKENMIVFSRNIFFQLGLKRSENVGEGEDACYYFVR